MFQIFKKKNEVPVASAPELLAVCDGTVIPMEEVKDPVFAQKMMGDGFAITTTGSELYALHDATVSMLFPSNHAFGLTFSDGMEVLVHIGIDTVNENGKGFECHVKLNKQIKAGDLIMTIDRAYLQSRGYDLTAMIIFTNNEKYQSFTCEYGKQVIGGKDIAARYVGTKTYE